jgi:cytidylate kinase
MQKALVITIDGPSGSGKGTIAYHLAKHLGWHYLDSGALYRAIGWAVLEEGIDPEDHQALEALLNSIQIEIKECKHDYRLIVNNRDISEEMRTEEVGNISSKVSAIPMVRAALLQKQRDFQRQPGLVTDGRDMGTVVFPEADLKLYITADLKERAKRRLKQLKIEENDASLRELEALLAKRDQRDENRAISPAKPASDVIIIDTTAMSISEVLEKVYEQVNAILGV